MWSQQLPTDTQQHTQFAVPIISTHKHPMLGVHKHKHLSGTPDMGESCLAICFAASATVQTKWAKYKISQTCSVHGYMIADVYHPHATSEHFSKNISLKMQQEKQLKSLKQCCFSRRQFVFQFFSALTLGV